MKIAATLLMGINLTDEHMDQLKQLGVDYLTIFQPGSVPAPKGKMPLVSNLMQGDYYKAEDLVALNKWIESHGLKLVNILLTPFRRFDKIVLGKPGRDEQIDNWCKTLRNMGKAGIPMYHYRWSVDSGEPLRLWRTSHETPGRGGAKLVSFDYSLVKNAPVSEFGVIPEKAHWDNLIYFLKAVTPVAEEAHVKLALHPDDPQVPGFAGVSRVIHTIKQWDRLFETVPSDNNTMCFCLGCFAQMFEPAGVYSAIKHFGKNGRIGYVHFRNVTGNFEKFNEVYPDEGKLDMLKTMKALKQAGFNGYIVPDHAPHGTLDSESAPVSMAFQIGYLKGILQGADALD